MKRKEKNMANKADRFFYENLVNAATLCCKASDYLVECLKDYNYDHIKVMLDKMHNIEHEADDKKHEMTEALAKAFVTPIDREDLEQLSYTIDNVADKVEEVIQKFYVYEIFSVTDACIQMAEKIAESCSLMRKLMMELQNFKKPASLRSLIIEINDLEEQCDSIYLESTLKAKKNSSDVLEIVSWRKIYDCMESCADACEHVADCVGTVIMKNT